VRGSADRNRSPIVMVPTPRGRVDVMHQEMRGLRKGSGWRTFWLAKRAGKKDWAEATTLQEAIRKATLLPPKKRAAWLDRAVGEARSQLEATGVANPGDEGEVSGQAAPPAELSASESEQPEAGAAEGTLKA
jgi:hypothetical protein